MCIYVYEYIEWYECILYCMSHIYICILGDPTGKDSARQILSEDTIHSNTISISAIIHNILADKRLPSDVTPSPSYVTPSIQLVNNNSWLHTLSYLDFLRDYGKYFSINRMLQLESVKSRLDREQSLSFLEFNYSILQAYDFYHLHTHYDVNLQIGGSDQWGNIMRYEECVSIYIQ